MSFFCRCGHSPSSHGLSTWPTRSRPCEKCVNCDRYMSARGCCIDPKPCPCSDLDQRDAS